MAPAPDRPATDTVAQALLTLTAGLGLFAAAMSVWLVAAGAKESTETGLYLVTFAVILPATVVGAPRLAVALRAKGVLVAAAGLWSAGLLLVLLGARVAYAIDGSAAPTASPVFLAALAAWAAGSAAATRLLSRLFDRAWPRMREALARLREGDLILTQPVALFVARLEERRP